jgi:Putative peptidoglycan binding domain
MLLFPYFLFFFTAFFSPDMIRRLTLIDNCYFLCPITKADVSLVLQKELARLGYYHGQIDGIMGSETAQALRWFQSVDKLPVSGQIDGATVQALRIG